MGRREQIQVDIDLSVINRHGPEPTERRIDLLVTPPCEVIRDRGVHLIRGLVEQVRVKRQIHVKRPCIPIVSRFIENQRWNAPADDCDRVEDLSKQRKELEKDDPGGTYAEWVILRIYCFDGQITSLSLRNSAASRDGPLRRRRST